MVASDGMLLLGRGGRQAVAGVGDLGAPIDRRFAAGGGSTGASLLYIDIAGPDPSLAGGTVLFAVVVVAVGGGVGLGHRRGVQMRRPPTKSVGCGGEYGHGKAVQSRSCHG